MAAFLKFENKYISINNIAQVELDSTSATCHDINIHPAQGNRIFLQLRVSEKDVADKIFQELGKALDTNNSIDLDAIKLKYTSVE